MEWLEKLAAMPGSVALGALALASLLEAGLLATGADFLLILVIAARPQDWLLATLIVSLASVGGSALGYWVGRGVGRPLIRRILPDRASEWIAGIYQRNDGVAVGVGALLPFVPFKHISLTAGFFELAFPRFLIVSTVTRTLRFGILGFASARYREQVREALVAHGLTIVVAILLLAGLAEACRRWWMGASR